MSKSRDFLQRDKKSCHRQTPGSPVNAEKGALREAGAVPKWRGLYAGQYQMSANFDEIQAEKTPGLRQTGLLYADRPSRRVTALIYGAKGETRTLTSKIPEPKSGASTNSATLAETAFPITASHTGNPVLLRCNPGRLKPGARNMGWTMGIEPTTTRITILHSTN